MLVQSASPVSLSLSRSGGSIIQSRLDIWRSTANGWQAVGSSLFNQVTQATESQNLKLPKGTYAAVFTCRVEESINGVYDFGFSVGMQKLYADKGNVNTTNDPHDSKAYKDQFVLEVL